MDRKSFIQAISIGLGVSLIPKVTFSRIISAKSKHLNKIKPKVIKDSEGKVLNVLSDIQTHKLTGSDTGNQIVEWVDNVDPGVGIPPHIHTLEDEIFRIIKGRVEIMIDDKTKVLEAGDIAYAPKNIPHSWKVVGTEKAQIITSAFPAGIESMFSELADLPKGSPDFEKIASICKNHGITFLKK